MLVNKIIFGFVPAEDRMWVEMTFATLYLDRAAARVNPPKSNMITLDHIVDKMYCEDSAGVMTLPVDEFFKTGKKTTNRGTNREVTNRGIVSVAHNKEAYTRIAKQFFCNRSANGEKTSRTMKTEVINRNFKNWVDWSINLTY